MNQTVVGDFKPGLPIIVGAHEDNCSKDLQTLNNGQKSSRTSQPSNQGVVSSRINLQPAVHSSITWANLRPPQYKIVRLSMPQVGQQIVQ